MTDHDAKLAAAKKRVADMDKNDGHEDRSIGTLWIALETGLRGTDDGPAYDALVMLSDIRETIKNIPMLHVMSIKAMFEQLEDGKAIVGVSSPSAPRAKMHGDPENN